MPQEYNRKLELFSTDDTTDIEKFEGEGCQIYVKFLPAPSEDRKAEKYLVTSLNIVPRDDVTEYWLTLLDHQTETVTDEEIRSVIRAFHKRGLHKSCKKIVSFIEYGESDTPEPSVPEQQTDSPVAHRFNFII